MRLEPLARAAQALNVSTDYLLDLTDDPTPASVLADRVRESISPTHLPVPFMRDVHAAARSGELVFEESDDLQINLARAALPGWTRPGALICIRATGESMVPTVRDGDLLAIDRSHAEPLSNELFVARTSDGLVVKRLQRLGRQWHLISDNPAYPSRPASGDDSLTGRVAWIGPATTLRV